MPKKNYKTSFILSSRQRSRIIYSNFHQRLHRADALIDDETSTSSESSVLIAGESQCHTLRDYNVIVTNTDQAKESVLNDTQNESNEICSFHLETDETREGTVPEDDIGEGNKQLAEVKNDELSFRQKLAYWAVDCRVTKNTLNKLLVVLKEEFHDHDLPSDSRSLLSTPRFTSVEPVSPGEYFHFGLRNGIINICSGYPEIRIDIADVSINVDGIPIANSTLSQFWPILGKLKSIKGSCPFVIGIYHGCEKPKDCNSFLKFLVEESKILIDEGIELYNSGPRIPVKISAFICDTPARSFICQTKGHTGFYGCNKCTTRGKYLIGRTCFPELNAPLRTNESFRGKEQRSHHIGFSIIEEIPNLLMVSGFPLDYMHLVCLGVMKKLLVSWIDGKTAKFKLPPVHVEEMSTILTSLQEVTSSEFVRKPRSLVDIKRFKATEFRQFLLYSGPLVLKKFLPKNYYTHFLSLHVAIRILCCDQQHLELNQYAEELLAYFTKTYSVLYGEHLVSYNVHGLIHLAKDSAVFGPLDSFSAFEFENYLQSLKLKLSNSGRPLKQIINRISEDTNIRKKNGGITLKKMKYQILHNNGPLLTPNNSIDKQYKKCTLDGFVIGLKSRDHCCYLANNSYIVIENIATLTTKVGIVIGRQFQKIENYYTRPCNSDLTGVVKASNLATTLKSFNITDIVGKVQKYPIGSDSFLLIKILHSIKKY